VKTTTKVESNETLELLGWVGTLLVLISTSRRAIISSASIVSRCNDQDPMQCPVRPLLTVLVTCYVVWIGDSIYWPFIYTHDSWRHFEDHCPRSITVSISRFLATDFITGAITVSLNYRLQILHVKSSLHSRTFNWALLQQLFSSDSPTDLD
jgi:hypothetical protein